MSMSGKAQAGPELYRHCIESSVLAAAGILLLAVLLPGSVHVWFLIACGAGMSAGLMYAALATAGSVAIGVWLLAWGITATSWMAAARILGPWHMNVLAGLILPVLALAMLGPVAIGRHRAALDREEQAREARANEKMLRRWEKLLAACNVEGATVLAVDEYPGGRQVHGRLGKVTGEGPRPGTIRDLRDATDLIAQHKRLHGAGAVTVEEKPGAELVRRCRDLHDRPEGREGGPAVDGAVDPEVHGPPGDRLAGHHPGGGRADAGRVVGGPRGPVPRGGRRGEDHPQRRPARHPAAD
jgi:hypothetical protein